MRLLLAVVLVSLHTIAHAATPSGTEPLFTAVEGDKSPARAHIAQQGQTAAPKPANRRKPPPRQIYPEPEITYRPSLPPLGQYSVPGVCQAIHDNTATTVTLQNGETLNNAASRLKAMNSAGGVIEIPWNVENVQCDALRMGKKRHMARLTLRGLPGPQGQRPRFYCRAEKVGGTLPKGKGGGVFWMTAGNTPGGQYLVENLHVDGYGSFIAVGGSASFIARNNYMHHATNNGITKGKDAADSTITGVNHEFCGNEFAYAGQGNTKHTFYITSSWKPGANIGVTLVDNLLHSCNWSSCFKSVADSNTLINNRFYKTLETDPSYGTAYSQMLVDIGACATNVLEGNYFHIARPEPKKWAGGLMIGIRNRKDNRGCHRPLYDSEEFWSDAYWASLNRQITLKTTVHGNIFDGSGENGWNSNPMTDWGTYPNRPLKSFGPACLLPSPEGWYERHKTYVSDNTYRGIDQDRWYTSSPPGHFKSDRCGPFPLPDRRESDFFSIGSGETFVP